MNLKFLIDTLGWKGSILYLPVCTLVSLKKTEGDSAVYQGVNIFAGILLVVYTLYLGAYATTGLNTVWAAIGLSTLPPRLGGDGVLRLFTLGRKWLTRN